MSDISPKIRNMIRWRRRSKRLIWKLTIDGHRYELSYHVSLPERALYGELRPSPPLNGTQPAFGRPDLLTRSEAVVEFKRWLRNDTARFNSIRVPIEHQRQGVATRMVEALFAAWPTTSWWNSGALNEMSGPLFLQLHERYPSRLRRPHWPQ